MRLRPLDVNAEPPAPGAAEVVVLAGAVGVLVAELERDLDTVVDTEDIIDEAIADDVIAVDAVVELILFVKLRTDNVSHLHSEVLW